MWGNGTPKQSNIHAKLIFQGEAFRSRRTAVSILGCGNMQVFAHSATAFYSLAALS